MKWAIIILMVLCASAVYAEDFPTYKVKEAFEIAMHLSNATGDVVGANCNVQIRDTNYTVLDNLVMGDAGGGWYNRTYNVSRAGTYICRLNCTQGTYFAADTCDFIAESKMETIMINLFYLTFALAAALLILALVFRDTNFAFASGFMFIVAGIFLFRFGYADINNFITESVAIVIIGVGCYVLFRASVEHLEESER